jgi:hypothetical protein
MKSQPWHIAVLIPARARGQDDDVGPTGSNPPWTRERKRAAVGAASFTK